MTRTLVFLAFVTVVLSGCSGRSIYDHPAYRKSEEGPSRQDTGRPVDPAEARRTRGS